MSAADDYLGHPPSGWRLHLYILIFKSETRLGRLFDKILVAIILFSIVVVVVDSVVEAGQRPRVHLAFSTLEWLFTAIFTLEYVARLTCVKYPWRYVRSFYGVVDLLALLPTYLALFIPETHALIDVRVLRLLRVFRIFKLTEYLSEYQALGTSLVANGRKLLVFLSFVLMIVLVSGTLMYVIEGPEHGYTSIPTSVYWAITTITTVGFGDITPKTDLGRFISSVMMLLGWGTLAAAPMGLVASGFSSHHKPEPGSQPAESAAFTSPSPARPLRICNACGTEGHTPYARFCMHCGAQDLSNPSLPSSAPPG